MYKTEIFSIESIEFCISSILIVLIVLFLKYIYANLVVNWFLPIFWPFNPTALELEWKYLISLLVDHIDNNHDVADVRNDDNHDADDHSKVIIIISGDDDSFYDYDYSFW